MTRSTVYPSLFTRMMIGVSPCLPMVPSSWMVSWAEPSPMSSMQRRDGSASCAPSNAGSE